MGSANLVGWKTGKLRVMARAENTDRGAAQWLCQCECGNYRIARADHLLQGRVRRCETCALTHGRVMRIEVWYYPVIDHSYGPDDGQAGFARVWQGERELGAPQWIAYQPSGRRNSAPSVLVETARRLALRGELTLASASERAITAWAARHKQRTTYHAFNDGHEVWLAWLDLTGEWRGPAQLLPEWDDGEPE